MRTKKNPGIPMVPKIHLKNVEHQRNQYKTERDTLIDDLKVLREKNEKLERENRRKHYSANKNNKYYKELWEKTEELKEDLIRSEAMEDYWKIHADEIKEELKEYYQDEITQYKQENKALRLQSNTYFDEWQEAISKNKNLQSVIGQFRHDLQYTEWEIVPHLKQEIEKLEREKKELHLETNTYFDERLEAIEKYFP